MLWCSNEQAWSAIVILFGLARRTTRQIEKASLFYRSTSNRGMAAHWCSPRRRWCRPRGVRCRRNWIGRRHRPSSSRWAPRRTRRCSRRGYHRSRRTNRRCSLPRCGYRGSRSRQRHHPNCRSGSMCAHPTGCGPLDGRLRPSRPGSRKHAGRAPSGSTLGGRPCARSGPRRWPTGGTAGSSRSA